MKASSGKFLRQFLPTARLALVVPASVTGILREWEMPASMSAQGRGLLVTPGPSKPKPLDFPYTALLLPQGWTMPPCEEGEGQGLSILGCVWRSFWHQWKHVPQDLGLKEAVYRVWWQIWPLLEYVVLDPLLDTSDSVKICELQCYSQTRGLHPGPGSQLFSELS